MSILNKILKPAKTLVGLLAILFFVLSIIAFLVVQFELLSEPFQFNSKGIANFISSHSSVSAFYFGFLTLIVAYLSFERFDQWLLVSKESAKNTYFQEWRNVLNERLDFLKLSEKEVNQALRIDVYTRAYAIFNYLYRINFSIENKEQLKSAFEFIFAENLNKYEQSELGYRQAKGVYLDEKYCFTQPLLWHMLDGMLLKQYSDLRKDLINTCPLYLEDHRRIDKGQYLKNKSISKSVQ